MRLVLDEMLAPAIAEALRERGHDVESVKGNAVHQSLADADVMAVARAQRRAIVTNNVKDFRPLHYELDFRDLLGGGDQR